MALEDHWGETRHHRRHTEESTELNKVRQTGGERSEVKSKSETGIQGGGSERDGE